MTHRLVFRLDMVDEDNENETDWITAQGILLLRLEIEASGVSDVEYFHLYFPTVSNSKGQLFALTIASADAKPGEAVTLWLSCADHRIPGHVRFRAREHIEEGFGLQAKLITSNPIVDISYPRGLLYSPLSSCNMNCIHCISRHSRQRAILMSDSIRQDIKEHAESKQLQWMFTDYSGDILFVDRKNPGELDFIFSLGIAIHVDTNGAYLDAATIEKIMTSPVDAVSISVDAAEDETYP